MGGERVKVDEALEQSQANLFGALYLPGGIMCADHLRGDGHAIDFVRCFFPAGKPVAAMGHAVAVLIDADVLAGRTVTSWPAIHADVQNAGALWVQQAVVRGPANGTRGVLLFEPLDVLHLDCQPQPDGTGSGDAAARQGAP